MHIFKRMYGPLILRRFLLISLWGLRSAWTRNKWIFPNSHRILPMFSLTMRDQLTFFEKNARILWNLTIELPVSIGSSTNNLIPSPHKQRTNGDFRRFINLRTLFGENFDKFSKIIENGKFSIKIPKNLEFVIAFSTYFKTSPVLSDGQEGITYQTLYPSIPL